MTVEAEVVELLHLSERDISLWHDLRIAAVDPNPYFTPEYLHTKLVLAGPGTTRHAIVVRDQSAWYAFLPFITSRADRPWFAAHSTASEFAVSTPLVRRGHELDSVRLLLDGVARHREATHGVIDLPRLPGDLLTTRTIVEVALRHGHALRIRERSQRPHLRGGDMSPPLLGHLSKQRRKAIARNTRRLQVTEGMDIVLRDVTRDPGAVDRFIQLEMEGWKGQAEHGDAIAVHHHGPTWFRECVRRLGERDAVAILEISGADGPIYMDTVFLEAGTGFAYRDAYAERLQRFSPGTIGRTLSISHFAGSTGVHHFDPCMDAERYPLESRLYPHRREYIALTIGGKRMLDRWLMRRAGSRWFTFCVRSAARARRLYRVRWTAGLTLHRRGRPAPAVDGTNKRNP